MHTKKMLTTYAINLLNICNYDKMYQIPLKKCNTFRQFKLLKKVRDTLKYGV